MRRKLRDMAIAYAVNSIIPKGVKNTASGEISPSSGFENSKAANANPVVQAEKNPQTIPNPGINITSAMVRL